MIILIEKVQQIKLVNWGDTNADLLQSGRRVNITNTSKFSLQLLHSYTNLKVSPLEKFLKN